MKDIKASDEKQTFFIDYSVVSDYSPQSGLPSRTVNIKAYTSKSMLVIESNLVSVYVDTIDAFAIAHDQKVISRNDGSHQPTDGSDVQKMFEQQLFLLNKSRLDACLTKQEGNRSYRYTRFWLDKETSEMLKMKSFVIWFDIMLNTIYKVEMHYFDGQIIENQTIIYNNINIDYKPQLKGRALDRVLNSNGSLVSKYKGYTFINN
jgi:hypothetical protein